MDRGRYKAVVIRVHLGTSLGGDGMKISRDFLKAKVMTGDVTFLLYTLLLISLYLYIEPILLTGSGTWFRL